MKNRFGYEKKQPAFRNLLISLCFFAAIIIIFWRGVSAVSTRADEEEMRTLNQAVMRGVTYCYALEGNYPGSLDYLKENYGLFYDEEKYFIDYQPLGSNIMPDITIIRRIER